MSFVFNTLPFHYDPEIVAVFIYYHLKQCLADFLLEKTFSYFSKTIGGRVATRLTLSLGFNFHLSKIQPVVLIPFNMNHQASADFALGVEVI